MSVSCVLRKGSYIAYNYRLFTLATVARFLAAIKVKRRSPGERIFSAVFSRSFRHAECPRTFGRLFFNRFTWHCVTAVKIKWQNGDDGPYFVALSSSPAFFPFSFLSPFSFTFCFRSLGSYPSSLPFFFSFSNVGRIVRNSSGARDRGARFLSLTFDAPIFVLRANPGPDKARFHRGNFVDSLRGTRVSQTRHGSLLLPLIVGRYYPRVPRDTLVNIIRHVKFVIIYRAHGNGNFI